MAMKLHRHAYQRLIDEDIAWLMAQPRTLEREHIAAVLRASPDHEYENTAERDELREALRVALGLVDGYPGCGGCDSGLCTVCATKPLYALLSRHPAQPVKGAS